MKQKMFLMAIVFALSITLSGCSFTEKASEKAGEKILEKSLESQTGQKVDVDSKNGASTIKTEDGTMSFSEDGNLKLPDNFPEDIFIYPDAKIGSSATGDSGKKEYSIFYKTSASFGEVFSRYKDEMVKNGWKKEGEREMVDVSKSLSFVKGNLRVGVSIMKSSGAEGVEETVISLIVTEEVDSQE